jgi:hypothetical protein
MVEHHESWHAIVDSGDQASAVRDHLSFLTDGDECVRLLDQLMNRFVRAQLGDDQLELVFASQYDLDVVVTCDPPYDGDVTGAAASVGAVTRIHNGIAWESLGGGWYGYSGFDEDGRFIGAGGWEYDALLDAEEENEAFLAEVAEAGLKAHDVAGALDFGQNWAVWHPTRRNLVGEPRLYFVSHADCVATPVASADHLRFGPVLLRVMAQYVAGLDLLPEMYD